MLSRRWQFGNVHLLPSGDVFSAFATATPYRGICSTPVSGNRGMPKRRAGFFCYQDTTKVPKPCNHSLGCLTIPAILNIRGCPREEGAICLFTRKITFTGDTRLIERRKSIFFVFVHSTEVSWTMDASYGAYFFISQKYSSHMTQSRDTVERPETGQGVTQ